MGKSWNRWTASELNYLDDRIGSVLTPVLIKNFQAAARRHGWSKRSDLTVLRKIEDRVKGRPDGRKCVNDNWNKTALAKLLKVPIKRVHQWVVLYGLPCRIVSRSVTAISQEDFYEWAYFSRNHRHLRWADPEALQWLLDDERLVRLILRCPVYSSKPVKGNLKTVQCVDTGEIFKSVRAAGKAHYVSPTAIAFAARNGTKSLGRQYEYVYGDRS